MSYFFLKSFVQNLQVIYLTIVALLSIMALLLQFHPKYFSSLWASKRLASFGAIAAFGFLPVFHWTYIYGGLSQSIVQVREWKPFTLYAFSCAIFSTFDFSLVLDAHIQWIPIASQHLFHYIPNSSLLFIPSLFHLRINRVTFYLI